MESDKIRKVSKLFNRIIGPLIVAAFVGFEFYIDWSSGLSYSKMQSNAIVNLVFISIPVIIVAIVLRCISNNKIKDSDDSKKE